MSTTQFQSQSDESLSSKVLTTVAAQKNLDPTELEPSLYEVIDSDALDTLFTQKGGGGTRPGGKVRFTYNGYEIRVSSNGDVRAEPVEE